jgi:hypothetical protein
VIRARLAILTTERVLADRVLELVKRVQQDGAGEAWDELYRATQALAACAAIPASEPPTDLLTSQELQDRLGVSRRTLRRRRARGELQPVKAGGRGRSHKWAAEAAR